MARHDPVSDEFYGPVEACDAISDGLFYLCAALSIGALFVDRSQVILYDAVSTLFAIGVIASFSIGLVLRLYLLPRAEDRRRRDFFTNAYGVNLAPEQTDGYYNNQETEPTRKVAVQLLEDSLFTKVIARRMARSERLRVGVYAGMWLACVISRRIDMGVVLVVSQTVFSEQLLSKWLRLEWLRSRAESVHAATYSALANRLSKAAFAATTIETMALYETTKANAAITLSSRLFRRMNPALSAQWDTLRATLKL